MAHCYHCIWLHSTAFPTAKSGVKRFRILTFFWWERSTGGGQIIFYQGLTPPYPWPLQALLHSCQKLLGTIRASQVVFTNYQTPLHMLPSSYLDRKNKYDNRGYQTCCEKAVKEKGLATQKKIFLPMFLMILVLFKKLLKIDNQLGTFFWRILGFQETSFTEAKLVSRKNSSGGFSCGGWHHL